MFTGDNKIYVGSRGKIFIYVINTNLIAHNQQDLQSTASGYCEIVEDGCQQHKNNVLDFCESLSPMQLHLKPIFLSGVAARSLDLQLLQIVRQGGKS